MNHPIDANQMCRNFDADESRILYDVIFHRRDIRSFLPDVIDDDVLRRIITAAHAAPSVGYMQPWNFLMIDDVEIRKAIYQHFQEQNQQAAQQYSGKRKQLYDSLKLEGILQSPLNIVVTCDSSRGGTHVLGRHTIPETDRFSVCCAVQNLWLAARAENIGVGWVSILEPETVKAILHIPKSIQLIAYLCIGYTDSFSATPELERKGWRSKINLDELCFYNQWNKSKL